MILNRYMDNTKIEAGVDEAGRGPLFGRVYTAAAILPPNEEEFNHSLMRVKKLGMNKDGINELNINYTSLCKKIIDRLYNKIPTHKIDELTAQQCASLSTTHPDYGALASRILISNHHKNANASFLEVTQQLWENCDIHNKHSPIINETYYRVVQKYTKELEEIIDYERDYLIDYFGFKTLERAYLMRINQKIIERPQHMWLRVAVAIHVGQTWTNVWTH